MAFQTNALIDSGANGTFIPLEFIDLLGITTLEETELTIGAGGNFNSYLIRLDSIDCLKANEVFCSFDNFLVRVPVAYDLIPFIILGRDSIFTSFDITFRENKQQIIFRPPKR
jgi:hypothetical protein